MNSDEINPLKSIMTYSKAQVSLNSFILHNAIFLHVLFRRTTKGSDDSNNYKTNNKQSKWDINSDFRLYSCFVARSYLNSQPPSQMAKAQVQQQQQQEQL